MVILFSGINSTRLSGRPRDNRNNPIDLSSVYLRSNKGEMIQLDNLVKLSEQNNPPQLYRFNRYVSATVSAQPAKGVTLGQGIEEMRNIANETLDETFSTIWPEHQENMTKVPKVWFLLFFWHLY